MTLPRILLSPPDRPRRCGALGLAGLLVAGLLALAGSPADAVEVDSPSGLTASEAANPVLRWNRVSGATGYEVELSRTPEFTPANRIGSLVSTLNVSYVPTVQLPRGSVYWQVRARSGNEVSAPASSSFDANLAAAPTQIRPVAGTEFQAPSAPYFSWEPVAGATSYTVQVGPNADFVDTRVPGFAERTQKTTAAYLTGYPTVGGYFWRVRAELGSGHATDWTASTPFEVVGLPAVERTSPTEGEAREDVVLDWEPVPGAATYQVQVSTDNGFLTTAANVSGIVGTRWSPTTTLRNTTYFWRVRAVDASGNPSDWYAHAVGPDGLPTEELVEPWSFRRAWSDQPQLVHPRGSVGGSQPFFFEWTAIARASSYTVYLSDSTGRQLCSASTVHTTYADEGCIPPRAGDYTWKVQAIDGPSNNLTAVIGQSAASFYYEPPAPITPASDGALSTGQVTGQAASMTGTTAHPAAGSARETCTVALPDKCENLRQTPVLSWDPVPGATEYRLTLAYDVNLTNIVSTFNAVPLAQPLYTFTKTLPDSQAGDAYLWVVQPCNGPALEDCAPIEFPRHGFAKKTVGPNLVRPAQDAVVHDDVTLDWSSELSTLRGSIDPLVNGTSSLSTPAATEARTYTVQTSTDRSFTNLVDNATLDDTTFTSPTNTYPEGTVFWRVRAEDGSSNPTVWSEVRSFEKRSPIPQLHTPAPGAALAQDSTFSWRPLNFAASYDIEVYAGATRVASANTKHASWAPSDPIPYLEGDYTWRVRRVDAKSRVGAWSQPRTFTVTEVPPALDGPDEGSLVPPTGAVFSWLPDSRATSYRFERRRPGDASSTLAETVTTRATAWAPTAALAAGTAQWRVVALDVAGKVLGTSAWRTFMVVDPPAEAEPVRIDGSGKVGTDLLARAPRFDPAVETTTYQWFRGTSRIAGATGATYTVTAGDKDRDLSVVATGVLTGYRPATSTSNAVRAVDGDALVAIYAPSVDGEPVVGKTLTVQPGQWPQDPRLTYQWFRDGVVIPSATRTTYTLTSDSLGREVHVVETATVTGRQPGTAASEVLTVVAPPAVVATTAPRVTGSPSVGQSLAVDPGTWNGNARFTYQWLRNGSPISGATSSAYRPTVSDVATRLSAEVQATAAGFSDGAARSNSVTVARLGPTMSLSTSKPSVTTKQRVSATVRVSASGLASPGGSITIYDASRKLMTYPLGTGTGKTVRLPKLRAGRHTIKAVYSGSSKVAGASRAVTLRVTNR